MAPASGSPAPYKRTRSTVNSSSPHPVTSPIESLASLLIRSVLVLFLLFTSLLLALAAWFSLRSFLKVDPVIGKERVWLQYGEFRTPYAFVDLPNGKYGAPGEAYDLSLELRVPSSQQNLVMGNFMVSVSLLNSNSEPVLNNSRPAILTHPAYPKFSHLLPLRPIPPPSQTLNLPLLESIPLNRNSWSSRKVDRIYLEVGRKDAHPEFLDPARSGQVGMYTGTHGQHRIGGELQVYESWLTIEAKLYGLRALIRSHPYLAFSFFFPTFLLTELLAALAVYAYFVFRPESQQTSADRIDEQQPNLTRVKVRAEAESTRREEFGSDIKRENVKGEDEESFTTSEPPSGTAEIETEEEEEEEKWKEERRRQKREREAGPGGVQMSEANDETETEPETETELETEEGEGSEEWAAIEREGETGDKDFDDAGTVAGSETTRATRSTFGPSVAGTASTRTTATSTRDIQGLRERQARSEDPDTAPE
ncbi:seipin [Sporobolomyces koalae]|uniref:seipin n=1 Tax=Sporobolomyces koalae TaxID=500713 RepID=UPI00318218E5